MIFAAWLTSWTPASWIEIWSLPCLVMIGSETPSLSTRFRMIVTDAVEIGRRQLDALRRLRLEHVLEAALEIEALLERAMRGRAGDGDEHHAAECEDDQHDQD